MQSLPTVAPGHTPGSALNAPGPLVLDRYRLLERLGAGGFGVVWRARDERASRQVAVKRIPLGPGGDPARAAREALAVGRLSHPAIVHLHEARFGADGFYLVSELVDGPTLAQLYATGAADDARLLTIIDCVAQALVHAHARGVIHRDVKPQNILVPSHPTHPDARAKLTDFGGAQLAGEDALTRTGDVVGTLAYMAPEQAEGRGAGPSADLYAVALVLFEGLTGSNPVRGAGPADTARRLGRPLPSLARARPDLHPRLIAAVDTALDPRPTDRGRLEDLIEALAEPPPRRRRPARRRLRPPRVWLPPPPRPRPPAPGVPDDPRRAAARLSPAPAARLVGAVAAGLLMTVALRLLLPDPRYAPLGGALAAASVFVGPRLGWLAGAAFVVVWLVVSGAPGSALVVACAALPAPALLRRPGPAWSAPALAPLAALAGLAGVFPALAGQAGRWPRRAAVGALGFWWLMLAQALVGQRLWLGPPSGTLGREAWQSTLPGAARHALEPLLIPSTLAGAALWALGAAVLPWMVRGRRAAHDVVAAIVWAGLLTAAARLLERGLSAPGAAGWPRGAAVGAAVGVLVAVAGAALRMPASHRRVVLHRAQRGRVVEGEGPV